MAGIGEGLMLVAFCGSCTFLTSISLSAIATNGAMKVLHTQRGLVVMVIIISSGFFMKICDARCRPNNNLEMVSDLMP